MFFLDVTLSEAERGLLFKDGVFARFLEPGVHRGFELGRAPRVVRLSLLSPYVDLPDAKVLAAHPDLAERLSLVRVGDAERGLVFIDGNFVRFLAPGAHAFLRLPNDALRVEVVDVSSLELVHPAKDVLTRAPNAREFLEVVDVPELHAGVLFVDGAFSRTLAPGRVAFWKGVQNVLVTLVDLRQQSVEIQGQELMTKDKVSLRVNLTVRYRVLDAVAVTSQHADAREALYRELQLALREEIGALTLDELLERKVSLGGAIVERLAPELAARGFALLAAGLRDVVLPGDMRTLFNRVIEAEKRAQADMIARREETAATRSLLNTARLLEGNPTLLRLKELEVTERIAEKIGSLSVTGGVEGLVEAIRGSVKLT